MTNIYLLIYFATSIPLLVAIGAALTATLNHRGKDNGPLHTTKLRSTLYD